MIKAEDDKSNQKISEGKLYCSNCKKKKYTSEFYINKSRTRGFMSYCKECMKEKSKRNK